MPNYPLAPVEVGRGCFSDGALAVPTPLLSTVCPPLAFNEGRGCHGTRHADLYILKETPLRETSPNRQFFHFFFLQSLPYRWPSHFDVAKSACGARSEDSAGFSHLNQRSSLVTAPRSRAPRQAEDDHNRRTHSKDFRQGQDEIGDMRYYI